MSPSVGLFFSVALTLFFVIDAFGNISDYLHLLKDYTVKEQRKIAVRELLIALVIMFVFHYLGEIVLSILGVSKMTVQISGGIILFLIAIRLIFSTDDTKPTWEKKKPYIVPIATPMIAGPSVLSVIMIFAIDDPTDLLVLGAILTAWFVSSVLIYFAKPVHKILKDRGLAALQRLMGLIVAIVAVQMFLSGVGELIKK